MKNKISAADIYIYCWFYVNKRYAGHKNAHKTAAFMAFNRLSRTRAVFPKSIVSLIHRRSIETNGATINLGLPCFW